MSDIDAEFRLVYAFRTERFSEIRNDNSRVWWNAYKEMSGQNGIETEFTQEIAYFRNLFSADVVALIVGEEEDGCGLSYSSTLVDSEKHVYTINSHDRTTAYFTFAHEIVHLMVRPYRVYLVCPYQSRRCFLISSFTHFWGARHDRGTENKCGDNLAAKNMAGAIHRHSFAPSWHISVLKINVATISVSAARLIQSVRAFAFSFFFKSQPIVRWQCPRC